MMHSWVSLNQAACLALVVSLTLVGCEGSDDCTDSEAIGIWHQTAAEPSGDTSGNWTKEDVIFRSNCVVEFREYEGTMKQGSGFYDDHGGELHLLFGGGKERTAEQDGENMTMVTSDDEEEDEWSLTLSRTSKFPDGPSPDAGPSGNCCHCSCMGCGHEQNSPMGGGRLRPGV
jgi:hypothetical protein